MSPEARRKPKGDFAELYRSALSKYAKRGGEAALSEAYELGRTAMADGQTLIEIARLHHEVLLELVKGANNESRGLGLLRAGGEFLAESLSPHEMAQRGFQDAVKALRQLNETLEGEIKRIAHAVHDEAGQLLVAVHLGLAEVAHDVPRPQQEQLGRIEELLGQVEKQLRQYSHELRPTILEDLGWIPAIRFLAEGVSKRAHLPIHIRATVPGRFASTIETALYRIVQEALNNAVKHARPENIWVRAWRDDRVLCCSVRDDGGGFDVRAVQAARSREGLGLIGMQERLSAIGGTLHIESIPGRGTKLLIRIPLEAAHANSNRAGRRSRRGATRTEIAS